MTRTDPLLAAGVNTCHTCRAVGYPSAATWVDDDLLLATYAAPCEHHDESTQLVKPSQIKPLDEPVSRCMGITAADTWCRKRARPGSQFCAVHDRQDAQRGAW